MTAGAAFEFPPNDYVTDSHLNDGGAFQSFTPVRESADNTALVTGKMSGIPVATLASCRNARCRAARGGSGANTADGVEFGDLSGVPVNRRHSGLRATLRGPASAPSRTARFTGRRLQCGAHRVELSSAPREGSAVPAETGTSIVGGALLFTLGEPRLNGKGNIAAGYLQSHRDGGCQHGNDRRSSAIRIEQRIFSLVNKDSPRSCRRSPDRLKFVSFAGSRRDE